MHQIEPEDIALGTVERHESEPVSWHGLESVRENLATDNCGLAEMKVESLEMQVMRNGEPYGSTLRVPAVPHPMEEGKLLFLGKPFESTYRLFDNEEFLAFAQRCFDAAGLDKSLAFTTTLFAGRRVTVAKHIPEADFKDAHGHEIKSYFNLLNSFDGTWPVFANISEIRTVCFNTATANLSEGGATVRHTPDALENFVRRFPDLFATAIQDHKGSANDYLALAEIRLSKSDAEGFFAALIGGSKLSTRANGIIQESLLPLFSKGRGCYGESAADAYNAVTEYYTHNGTVEANSVGGTSDNRKREAKELLLSDSLMEKIEKGKELIAKREI